MASAPKLPIACTKILVCKLSLHLREANLAKIYNDFKFSGDHGAYLRIDSLLEGGHNIVTAKNLGKEMLCCKPAEGELL